LSDGQKKKYIEMFGSFTEPFCVFYQVLISVNKMSKKICNILV